MKWLTEIEADQEWLKQYAPTAQARIAKLIAAVRMSEKALREVSRYAPNGDKGEGEYAWTVGLLGWDALTKLRNGEFGTDGGDGDA